MREGWKRMDFPHACSWNYEVLHVENVSGLFLLPLPQVYGPGAWADVIATGASAVPPENPSLALQRPRVHRRTSVRDNLGDALWFGVKGAVFPGHLRAPTRTALLCACAILLAGVSRRWRD